MDPSSRSGARLVAVVLTILLLPACTRHEGGEEIESAAVPTISAATGMVVRRDLVEPLLVRGRVTAQPNEDVKLASQVPGRVVAMRVAEGDSIRAGQVVAEIEAAPLEDQDRQARAALAQAKAALENARLNLARTEKLFDRGIASGKEVEDARAEATKAEAGVEEAQAALATADRQLGRARVRSPIAGQVVKRFVGVGEQVDGTPAQPLLEVANVDRVEVAAHVPAEHLGRVGPGQRVLVASDAYPERTFDGDVVAIAPAIDAATNTALVRIRVTNAERLLKVGMFVQARIALQVKEGALVVLPSAIAKTEEGTAVYVVTGEEAKRTPVKIGLETPDGVEVLAGVREGQTVLTSAIHGLEERAKLATKP